jgi:signal transduction histidine kinase/CheY-like chemotaxis protein
MAFLDPTQHARRCLGAQASEEEVSRGRRVLAYAYVLSAAALGFGLFFVARGVRAFAVMIFFATALGVMTPLVMRVARSTTVAGNWLHLHMTWVLAWSTYHSGGINAPAMLWYVLLPVLALVANGHRAGIAWSLVSAAVVSAFYVLSGIGHQFPRAIDATSMYYLEWSSILSILAGVQWMLLAYDRQETVAKRRLEEANARLAIALEQADAGHRAKSAFLANTSHELRTPMNGVVGMASLLETTGLTAEQREYVETIHRSAESLLTAVDDILDLSQMHAGALALRPSEIDPVACVENVVAGVRAAADAKGLPITIQVGDGLPRRVTADAKRFCQILHHLLENAIKFTPAGSVVVRVSSSVASRLSIEVTDTGIGIREEDLDKLFERFSQVDDSSTRRFGGTGLGLAICWELVRLMNGEITVASAPNRGSTFRFTIAVDPAKEPIVGPRESPRRILVVEDDVVNQRVASAIIERLGYDVDVAKSGAEALSHHGEHRYGAIVMDCHMPGMDGFETATEIRRREGDRRTPIIALTASSADEDQARCLAAGMDDFLSKPVEIETMERILSRWISR